MMALRPLLHRLLGVIAIKVDEKQTRENVKAVLKVFRRLVRLSGKRVDSLIAIASQHNTIVFEDAEELTPEEECIFIIDAWSMLSKLERDIIYNSYMIVDELTVNEVATVVECTYATAVRYKGMALLSFATAYKPRNLTVWNYEV